MGGSMGVLIPKDLREQLQLESGDLMLITRYGPLLIMRRATAATVFDKDTIPAAALPPSRQNEKSDG